MSADQPTRQRTQIRYWLLIFGQWLLLTLAVAGAMARGSNALRDYISPNLSDAWLTVGALLAGFLLGLTVISPRILVPLAVLMCFVAAVIFGLIVYMPAWQGTLFRSTTLANYAQQQALFLGIWTSVPAIFGAVIGYLLAGNVRRALEIRRDGHDSEHTPWWERSTRSAAQDDRNS